MKSQKYIKYGVCALIAVVIILINVVQINDSSIGDNDIAEIKPRTFIKDTNHYNVKDDNNITEEKIRSSVIDIDNNNSTIQPIPIPNPAEPIIITPLVP